MPRVTVVLPVYNHQFYVRQTLQSVFAQDFSDYQVIAVDDGSTDASLRILDEYRYRIRVITMSHRGPAEARNRAIKVADSEYIAFMDADDLCAPERLRLQLEKLQKENLDLVASSLSFIDSAGLPLPGFWTRPGHARNDYWGSLLERNWIGTPSVTVRRSALESAGLFDEAFTHSEDYDLWLRIGRSHSIGFIEEPLVQCRRHSKNTSLDLSSHGRFERLALQKVDAAEAWKAFTRLYRDPEQSYEAWIWFLLRSGHASFRDEADLALRLNPQSYSVRFAMAVFLYDSGEYVESRGLFQTLMDKDAASHHNAGVLSALCGDEKTALEHFSAAGPDYFDAQYNLAALGSGRPLRLTRRPFRKDPLPMVQG